MSPLLFVLIMEYLTRILLHNSISGDLKFHLGCKIVQLNSICFADDLILLCKPSKQSFTSMLDGLALFLSATGLSINHSKSCLFVCGVSDYVKQARVHLVGVTEGVFPLTYLGVPLKPTKWTKGDCSKVVDKIRNLITCWGSRHLSFAGRIQLISSVIFGIRAYWMSIFCIPSSVIKEIDRMSRDFL